MPPAPCTIGSRITAATWQEARRSRRRLERRRWRAHGMARAWRMQGACKGHVHRVARVAGVPPPDAAR
eukprot:scaffold137007_cov127-Phaeocystis_antarctica.AAC.1